MERTSFEHDTTHKELEWHRKRTEIALSLSSMVLFQAIWGRDLPLTYVSENVMRFGYRATDLIARGTTLSSLIHPKDLEEKLRLVELHNQVGMLERDYTYRIRTADGTYRRVNQKSRIIHPQVEGPAMIVGYLRDLSGEENTKTGLSRAHPALHERMIQMPNA